MPALPTLISVVVSPTKARMYVAARALDDVALREEALGAGAPYYCGEKVFGGSNCGVGGRMRARKTICSFSSRIRGYLKLHTHRSRLERHLIVPREAPKHTHLRYTSIYTYIYTYLFIYYIYLYIGRAAERDARRQTATAHARCNHRQAP